MATPEFHQPEPITLHRYARLPGEPGWKVEAVRGFLMREPPPNSSHSRVQARLIYLLEAHVQEHQTGGAVLVEFAFVLSVDPLTVRIPDVAYVSAARVPAGGYPQARWHLSPDLAVEVVSPRNTRAELEARVEDFRSAGSRLVWVADPATRTVVVHDAAGASRLQSAGDELTGGEVLPAFRVPVLDIFPV